MVIETPSETVTGDPARLVGQDVENGLVQAQRNSEPLMKTQEVRQQ